MGMGSGWVMPSGTCPATRHVPEALVSKQEGDSWTCTPLAHPFVHPQSLQSQPAPSQTGTLSPHPCAGIPHFLEPQH